MIPISLQIDYLNKAYKKDMATPWIVMEKQVYLKYDKLSLKIISGDTIELTWFYRDQIVKRTFVKPISVGDIVNLSFADQIGYIPVEGLPLES